MTRKDYILIAEALISWKNNPNAGYGSDSCVDEATRHIAKKLEQDNPRFDRDHFLAVVRGEKDLNSRPARKA